MGSEQDLAAVASHRDLLPPIPRWATLLGWRAAHEPPFGAEVGWSAFKLMVAPVCAFCAAAASRW